MEVARLPKYIWIRYITNQGKYRTGGILWGNFYPKHLVLLNPKSRYPWRVQIATNHFYIRDNKAKLREKYEKEKLQDRINYIKHMLESSLVSNDLPHIIQCSYNAYSNIYKIIQPLRDRSR